MNRSGDTVRLLWTAGWDSTFRLLSAVLVHHKTVQPYYLTDPGRPSTPNELSAMDRIAAQLAARHPPASALVKKPLVSSVADVAPDAETTARFERLRARSHLGGQYDWLARFALQRGLTDLELAVHRDDKAAVFLEPHVVRDDPGGDPGFRLRPDPPDDDLRLFERFRFPVFDLTKVAMDGMARERGFAELMELTWFCHLPTPDGKPCGRCNPCRYTAEEGLGRRIPLGVKLRNRRRRVVERIKRPLRAAARWAGWNKPT